MPKPQYRQHFRDSWLQDPHLKDWLQVIESTTGQEAKCKFCGTTLRSHYGDLKSHGMSKKHQQNKKVITTQPKIPFKPEPIGSKKKQEARLALFTAMHTSIRVVDHLGEVYNNNHEKDIEKVQLHRTKCTSIIKNVLALHFTEVLKKDFKDQPFSLIIDESTDITVHKYLGLIIIYYSKLHQKIVSTFLDLVKIHECNAEGIVSTIKKTIKRFDLRLENLMGIGTDNASVMVGVNNGVYAKLKEEVPHLILVRCLCHSLQLAVSAAAKEFLPRNLEFLIRETYDWFSRSSSRQSLYKKLYETINDGQKPLKIVQACQTRWLSIESAVSRIYTQWLELKTHFSIAKVHERCHTAELLHSMYANEMNYAYISFLYPILIEINRVNKMFESTDTDHTKLCEELINLINMLVNKVTLPTNKFNIFTQNIRDFLDKKCYLGFRFHNQILEMREKGLPREDEEMMRHRCMTFIVNLIEEIKNRLPENLTLMKKISRISVEQALNHNKEPLTDIMTQFNKSAEHIARVDDQWHQIHLLKWNETKNTKKFWNEVLHFKDAQGESRFEELATFAFTLLILPHSNADVERLFSSMNVIKNKQRNRIKLNLLTAILRVRCGLRLEGKCCNDYEIPVSVIKQIGTKESYQSETEDDGADINDSSEEEEMV
ncbi:uncharacterized protein LOC126886893 [Diabrotica virgifera virgifera]|uniref:HAT C-terminal dimerisation domain-containing protein n=2 Tax=Diabrotica virgifera virgifera TaxID=50390 RepID=A0ABM5KIE1_DIAVI|nr:uncharacterized protein LOC126886893 [Diabrotica virgifera virgifera]